VVTVVTLESAGTLLQPLPDAPSPKKLAALHMDYGLRVEDQNAVVAHLGDRKMDCSRSRRPLIQEGGFPTNSANVKPGNLRPACPTAQ